MIRNDRLKTVRPSTRESSVNGKPADGSVKGLHRCLVILSTLLIQVESFNRVLLIKLEFEIQFALRPFGTLSDLLPIHQACLEHLLMIFKL